MINCNPETVSTDWDAADRLYFEPLTLEEVLDVVAREKAEGAVAQFGGQTPLKLAQGAGGGGRADPRHPARRRSTWPRTASASPTVIRRLGLRQPAVRGGRHARRGEEGRGAARATRCWCGRRTCSAGAAWRSSTARPSSADYWEREVLAAPEHPVLIDRFLERAVEIDVDALSDGRDVVICGVLEHIEEAGIHSGDSSCVFPSVSLPLEITAEVRRIARAARPRARRRRPAQPPARGARRPRLRPRGQPARLAHGAVHLQGDRRAVGVAGGARCAAARA